MLAGFSVGLVVSAGASHPGHAVVGSAPMSTSIDVVINGQTRRVNAGATVASLLGELGLGDRRVAVEKNREVVPRAQHASTVLADGDRLEVVTFVGGG
jgi:sulfur carrier protein